MTIGEKIKFLRLNESWSQIRLAAELGVSETTIRNYEAGRVNVRERHLQKLSEIFAVDITALRNDHPDTYNEVMQWLFLLADEYSLSVVSAEHVPKDDAVLVFNKRVLQNYLNAWQKKRVQFEQENDEDALKAWELNFPASLADDYQEKIKEAREKMER